MFVTVFLLRIKKLEKDRVLILQCKRNGWTNLSGELEQYEKELQNEKDAESESFLHYTQHLSIFMKESVSIMAYCFFQHQGKKNYHSKQVIII